MSKRELERRSVFCEVRAEEFEGQKIITGRPVVYDSRTDLGVFDEIIERGALAETDLRDVRFLVNHDISRIPLARSRRNNGNSTMQLVVDDEGLFVRILLDIENNTEARALYSAVQRGDITGMSFMFSVSKDKWEGRDTEHPLRRITKIASIVEVSACTFPAYEDTEIYARSREALESARQTLENARQRRALPPEGGDTAELELLKAQFDYKFKTGGN